MNTPADSPTTSPRSECTVIAPQLPLLRTGALSPDTTAHIEAHLHSCAACRSQRADFDRVETLLRSVYSPGASPFRAIMPDEIHSRIEQQTRSGSTPPTGASAHHSALRTSKYPAAAQSIFRRTPSSGSRAPAWLPQLTAVAAVIILVALFTLLFQTLAPKGSGTWSRIPIVPVATTSPIHYLGARTRWEQATQPLGDAQTSKMLYTFSHVDPRVMYRYQLTVKKVERSDDLGASWHTLPIPTQDVAPNDRLEVIVSPSPLDSQAVLLTYQVIPPNSTCPSGHFCEIQYISKDGGQHWQRLQLATGTALSVVGFATSPYRSSPWGLMLMAQGTHLFSALRSDIGVFAGQYRLVMSTDGGASWTPVDTPILASKQSVVESVATPTGSSLFVLTVATGALAINAPQVTRLLWRSDDQGQHWTRVGVFPGPQNMSFGSTHLIAATLGLDGHPLVYYWDTSETPEQQPQLLGMSAIAPEHVFVSRDGGATWIPAPRSGIPASDHGVTAVAGQLADGSLVIEATRFTTDQHGTTIQSDIAYYAWKPDDASWQQLTSTAPGQTFVERWVTPARSDTPETIWVLTRQGYIWILQRCALS